MLAGPPETGISLHLPQVYPRITLCKNPTPTNLCGLADPSLLIDPAVYPELDLYPPVSAEGIRGIPKTELISQGPRAYMCIVEAFERLLTCTGTGPSIYPWLQVYPGRVSAGQNNVATSRIVPMLQPVYPQFDICRLY